MGLLLSKKNEGIQFSEENLEKAFDMPKLDFNEFYLNSRNMIYSMNTNFNKLTTERMDNMLLGINEKLRTCFNTANVYNESLTEVVKERLLFRTDKYNIPNIELKSYVRGQGSAISDKIMAQHNLSNCDKNYDTIESQSNTKTNATTSSSSTTATATATYDSKNIDI